MPASIASSRARLSLWPCSFSPDQPSGPLLRISDDGFTPGLRDLRKKMRDVGPGCVAPQIIHFLKISRSGWRQKVEDLSKGMGQKLQFVITVLHEPSLIILDEPFSGLDPVNANLIKDEIYRLSKNGTTIIFSTHRMEQVEEICNHIVLVNKGKKILDGTVDAVKQDFKENLFGIQLETVPEAINSNAFNVTTINNKKIIVKINDGYKPNDVLGHFINSGSSVVSFQEILPSLNDIFIKLVEGTPAARQFEKISE